MIKTQFDDEEATVRELRFTNETWFETAEEWNRWVEQLETFFIDDARDER